MHQLDGVGVVVLEERDIEESAHAVCDRVAFVDIVAESSGVFGPVGEFGDARWIDTERWIECGHGFDDCFGDEGLSSEGHVDMVVHEIPADGAAFAVVSEVLADI